MQMHPNTEAQTSITMKVEPVSRLFGVGTEIGLDVKLGAAVGALEWDISGVVSSGALGWKAC